VQKSQSGAQHGLKVTAEGMEPKGTLELLATIGGDTAQGYHSARPTPTERWEEWLRSKIAA